MSQNTARAAQARLEQLVAARGWTLEDLAARCGVEHERLLDFSNRTYADDLGRIASTLAPEDGATCMLFLLGVDDDVPSVAEEVEEADDEEEDRFRRDAGDYAGHVLYVLPEDTWERVLDALDAPNSYDGERPVEETAEHWSVVAWARTVRHLGPAAVADVRNFGRARELIGYERGYREGARAFADLTWTYAVEPERVPGLRLVYESEERAAHGGAA